MPVSRRVYWKIVNNRVVGNFRLSGWELKQGQQGRRLTLCSLDEAMWQEHASGLWVRRSDHEFREYIIRRYESVYQQLVDENDKKVILTQNRVKSYLEQWVSSQKSFRSEKTLREYETFATLYLNAVGNHSLDAWEPEYAEKFHAYLKKIKPSPGKDSYAPATLNKFFRLLRAFYNWAFKNQHVNRQFYIPAPSVPKKGIQSYSEEDLTRLGDLIQTNLAKATTPEEILRYTIHLRAYMLAVYTLLRIGAIWALPLRNIDLTKKILRIRDQPALNWKNKSGKQVDKPIHPELLDYLREDLETRGTNEKWYLDNGEGKPFYASTDALTKPFSRYRDQLGLDKDVKPLHGIRAAGTTRLLRLGVDIRTVQLLLDHEDISTTARYDDRQGDLQRDALDKLPVLRPSQKSPPDTEEE